uniref:Uncharacterized protein n=1 Tax=Anopheles aquasalis TaxID=42839 RepID=T1E946_ANOAQ
MNSTTISLILLYINTHTDTHVHIYKHMINQHRDWTSHTVGTGGVEVVRILHSQSSYLYTLFWPLHIWKVYDCTYRSERTRRKVQDNSALS